MGDLFGRDRKTGDNLSFGVLILGIGLMFITNWWFPGMLFVVGAALIAQSIEEGRRWYSAQGAVFLFAIGAIFVIGFNIGAIFVLAGAGYIAYWLYNEYGFGEAEAGKRKNEDAAYSVGSDGELVPDDEVDKPKL